MSTPRIPLVNLQRLDAMHLDEWMEAIREVVIASGFILGAPAERFERAFAAYTGAAHAVGMGSGTDAVHLALRAAGVDAGDEVITVANTFAATLEAIVHAGARPVVVDVDDRTLLMDLQATEAAITPKTKAVVPVHLSGRPIDLRALSAITERHGIALVQDAAQAHGATFDGQPLSAFGIASAYSFYPGKNLGALGDAGAVVTNDDAVAARLRSLRDHGRVGKYDHREVGYCSRLDAVQAAVLERKLAHLPSWTERRREVAARYNKELDGAVRIIEESPGGDGVFHHFMIRVPERDGLQAFLAERGIQTVIHYPIPVHALEAFAWLGYPAGAFPVAERACREILSLPIDPVITDEEVAEVSAAVLEWVNGRS